MPASAPRIDDAEALVSAPAHTFPMFFLLSLELLCISLTSLLSCYFVPLSLVGCCLVLKERGSVGVTIVRKLVGWGWGWGR
jgi:hypothetical protein